MSGPPQRRISAARNVAFLVAGLVLGASVSAVAVTRYPLERLQVFAEALSKIETRYVDDREPDQLIYDAIGGLTQGLDDHSIFMDPERYREMREQTSGRYYGVGISVGRRYGKAFVNEPLEGSPAEDAGILAGDEILAVDDLTVEDDGAAATLAGIKGQRGTLVVLTLRRLGVPDPFEIAVRRDQVRTRSVTAKVLDKNRGYGWLRIDRFQRRTVDEVKRAVADLRDELDAPLVALVVDLRDNPGGYLNQAVAVADLWLADGVIVSTVERSAQRQADVAHAAGTDLDIRLAVLINGNSASAAEIVAGALQDYDRATLVGYTSYGKGSVQQFFDLSDGSALKLTTARYLTPSGRSIHGLGITPNLALGDRHAQSPERDLSPLLDKHADVADWVLHDVDLHVATAWLRDPGPSYAWFHLPDGDGKPSGGPIASDPAGASAPPARDGAAETAPSPSSPSPSSPSPSSPSPSSPSPPSPSPSPSSPPPAD